MLFAIVPSQMLRPYECIPSKNPEVTNWGTFDGERLTMLTLSQFAQGQLQSERSTQHVGANCCAPAVPKHL